MKRDDQRHILFWNLYPGLWWLCEKEKEKGVPLLFKEFTWTNCFHLGTVFFFLTIKLKWTLNVGGYSDQRKTKGQVCYNIINQSKFFFSFRFIYKFLRFELFSSKKTPTELFNQMEKWKNRVDSRLIISKEFLHAILVKFP